MILLMRFAAAAAFMGRITGIAYYVRLLQLFAGLYRTTVMVRTSLREICCRVLYNILCLLPQVNLPYSGAGDTVSSSA